MITREQLCIIGKLLKPHGINGEITATVDPEADLKKIAWAIVDIDGIFVPFFVNDVRRRSSESVLVTFDGITNEVEAKELCGKDLYCLREDAPELEADADADGLYAADLVGFDILDDASGDTVGRIDDFDDSTENALFIVSLPDGSSTYIPVADEYITDIDVPRRTITMDLPEGLV